MIMLSGSSTRPADIHVGITHKFYEFTSRIKWLWCNPSSTSLKNMSRLVDIVLSRRAGADDDDWVTVDLILNFRPLLQLITSLSRIGRREATWHRSMVTMLMMFVFNRKMPFICGCALVNVRWPITATWDATSVCSCWRSGERPLKRKKESYRAAFWLIDQFCSPCLCILSLLSMSAFFNIMYICVCFARLLNIQSRILNCFLLTLLAAVHAVFFRLLFVTLSINGWWRNSDRSNISLCQLDGVKG